MRKFSFSNRVVNIWNSFPNWVVSANTTNTFKARLDKFWHNQDVVYDFKAGPRPTCMPSFVLIRPTVWPQCRNVTDRTDRQWTDSIGQTVLQTVAQKPPNIAVAIIGLFLFTLSVSRPPSAFAHR